jgi:hypothetical protein
MERAPLYSSLRGEIYLASFPTRLLRHILAKHIVHPRLPTFACGLEVRNDLGAVANRDQKLFVLGFRTATQRTQWNHGLQLLRRERLSVGVLLCRCRDCLIFLPSGHLHRRRFRGFGSFGHSVAWFAKSLAGSNSTRMLYCSYSKEARQRDRDRGASPLMEGTPTASVFRRARPQKKKPGRTVPIPFPRLRHFVCQ